MDKKALVKDIIIVVLALAVAGLVYTGWSKGYLNFGSKKESSVPAQQNQDETTSKDQGETANGKVYGTGFGIIEGSLSYPSDFIPPMKICAEDINTKKQYCTSEHIKDTKYNYGEGYKISVPFGGYYVFATTQALGDYRAYYSEFKCGEEEGENSHNPILVEVTSSETISGVDACDWYK